MKYLTMLFLLYLFLKSFYYGLFEIQEKNNIQVGISVIVLAAVGLIFPLILLFTIY